MNLRERFYSDLAGMSDFLRTNADDCQIDLKIAEQERLIRKLTSEIGNLAVLNLDNGEEMSPEIMERYEIIKTAKQKIEEMRADKKSASRECPKCGAKVPSGMKYCGECGSPLNK